MRSKMSDSLKILWTVLGGLAIVVGLLAGLAQLADYAEGRRAMSTPPPTMIPTSTTIPTITPTPTIGPFQFLGLPKQVKAGEDIRISLQATPGAMCHVDYYTPDGSLSSARGTGSVMADSQGKCTWEWHVSANTLPGRGRLEVSINDIRETHEIEILPGN